MFVTGTETSKMREVCFLVGFIAVLMSLSTINAQCPTEDDAGDLSPFDIYRTQDFDSNENTGADGSITVAGLGVSVESVTSLQNSDDRFAASAELQEQIRVETEAATTDAVALDLAYKPHYYHTCPYKWHWVPRYHYYYRRVVATSTGTTRYYYWSYYPMWVVDCVTKYCQNSYDWWNWWDKRYRCFEEYRYVWTWVLRLQVNYAPDGTYLSHTLSKVLDRLWLPRGCCCRRYWWYSIATINKCPAK